MRFISKSVLGALTMTLAIGAVAAPGAFASEAKGQLVNKEGATLVKNKATLTNNTPAEISTVGGRWKCESFTGALTTSSKTVGTLNEDLNGCYSFQGACKAGGKKVIPMNNLEVTVVRGVTKTEDLLLVKVPAGKPVEFECSERKSEIRGEFLSTATPQQTLTKYITTLAPERERGQDSITKYVNASGVEVTVANPLEMKVGTVGAYEDILIGAEQSLTFEEEAELL
jgi:hypothetical protein